MFVENNIIINRYYYKNMGEQQFMSQFNLF